MTYDSLDPHFRSVLDHGFVYLKEVMGTDSSITDAARISYGAGTKSVREDRGLIRYLFRHRHSSPIEMAEVKFHLHIPIFVMRQLVRHRTASINEYSGRYSVMSDEFYLPDPTNIQPQTLDNKQGRGGELSDLSHNGVRWMMETTAETAYDVYRVLLGERTGRDPEYPDDIIYDPYSEVDPLLDGDFPGIARELARTVLPVSYYTSVYWKQNLWNLFHLLKLRTDTRAQYETRMVAEAMYELIKPKFPIAAEAYEDYLRDAVTLSRMEVALLRDMLIESRVLLDEQHTDEKILAETYGLTVRELRELKATFMERPNK